jgi:hypothetical protein
MGENKMDKIWLKHYPMGRPAEINPDQYSSLVDLMHQCCSQYGDAALYTNFDKTITFNQLEVRLCRLVAKRCQTAARCAHCLDDAQLVAVSGGVIRRDARRADGGQYQSALYRP